MGMGPAAAPRGGRRTRDTEDRDPITRKPRDSNGDKIMHPDETLTLPTECRPTEQSPGHDSIRRAPRRSGRGLRRAFFGAVAFLTLSAGAAYANDLSTDPCTAGDVEIVGSDIVINEPCVCTPGGFFSARVQFTVRNNTSTGRYCIALHLVPDGSVLAVPTDLILEDANGSSTAPGKSGKENYHDTVMYADIPNFPCSQGMVCFGQAGVVRGKCTPGSCTTISWNTSPVAAGCASADQSPPGGQCRHQQVCVVGYGATLACVTNCTAIRGTSSVLPACAIAPHGSRPLHAHARGQRRQLAEPERVRRRHGYGLPELHRDGPPEPDDHLHAHGHRPAGLLAHGHR